MEASRLTDTKAPQHATSPAPACANQPQWLVWHDTTGPDDWAAKEMARWAWRGPDTPRR